MEEEEEINAMHGRVNNFLRTRSNLLTNNAKWQKNKAKQQIVEQNKGSRSWVAMASSPDEYIL